MKAVFLAAVCLIAPVFGSVCKNKSKDRDWHKNAVIYEIYPRSCQDTNGDGIGDLRGIINHVDYITDLGVDAVWLNPIYPSPNRDFGYDISDLRNVNPEYGTMEDFEELVALLKSKGIYLIMDYVPNHTSDKHEWFEKSRKGETGYENYYVWRSPKEGVSTREPPNNWTCEFGGSMWAWDENRQKYFLHHFAEQQVDLNYENPKVLQEMNDVLKFWMDKGVYGFRMDAVYSIAEDQRFLDEPYHAGGDPNDHGSYDHIYTDEQPKTYEVLRSFKNTLEEYAAKTDNITRLMVTESWNSDYSVIRRYYGTKEQRMTTFPFNFFLIMDLHSGNTAGDWANRINDWYNQVMPSTSDFVANWVYGNHDQNRLASRFSREHADILQMIQLSLKGAIFTYYGDELAFQDAWIRREQSKDVQGLNAPPSQFLQKTRDPQRSPFAWKNEINGGFTNGSPWLPLTSDYWKYNAEAQIKSKRSHLQVYKAMIRLRNTRTFKQGDILVRNLDDDILVVKRYLTGDATAVTVANLGYRTKTVNLTSGTVAFPKNAWMFAASLNYNNGATYDEGNLETIDPTNIRLPPLAAVVVVDVPKIEADC